MSGSPFQLAYSSTFGIIAVIESEQTPTTQVLPTAPSAQGGDEDDGPEDAGVKILTKKEKEKLKKEREKARPLLFLGIKILIDKGAIM